MDCPKCSSDCRVSAIYNDKKNAERYRKYVCKNNDCKHTFYSVEFVAENTEQVKELVKDLRRVR